MGFLRDIIFGSDRPLALEDLEEQTHRSRFSDYLPFVSYDPLTKEYINSDESTGFLWECAPLAFADKKVITTLEGLLNIGLPYGSILQFILYSDNYIDDYLSIFKQCKIRKNKLVEQATENFVKFLNEGTKGMEVFQRTPIRNFRLFVALKLPGEKVTGRINRSDIYSGVKEVLNGAFLYPEPVPPEDLVDWMRKLFNDRPSLNNRHYDEEGELRRQLIFAESEIEHKSNLNALKIGSRYFRCCSVKNYPKKVDFFQTNELFGGVWGMISDSNQMITPFLFSLNVFFDDMKKEFQWKLSLVTNQARHASETFAPSLFKKKIEYMKAVDDLQNKTFVRIIPTMWVWSDDPKTAVESISRTKRLWESSGYIMQEDRGILPILFIVSLPFGLYTKGDVVNKLSRDFPAQADAVAPVLPVQADFAGGGRPIMLFVGRKGQIVRMDLFGEKAVNHNLFVAASSGAGKSFAVNYLTYNYYSAGAKIRIVDIGGSYKKMTGMFNARYLDFDEKAKISLNPFTVINEVEKDLQSIAAVVTTMCFSATGKVQESMAALSATLINKAVHWAYEQEGSDACIDTVWRYLATFPQEADGVIKDQYTHEEQRKFTDVAQTLAFNLEIFTSKNPFGKWFAGPATFDISADDFVVLELEQLKHNKSLFNVITLQVIDSVTKDLYLSNRANPRLVIFDEAWQFIRDDNSMKDVIEEGLRRARKYNGSFTIITQSIQDVIQFGSVGHVIMSNTDFKFYLQSPDFAAARDKSLIQCGDFELRLLNSVKTNKPKYSEIFMKTPYGDGAVRLVVDPWSYYIYTSAGQEIAEIDKIAAENDGDYTYAIEEMVRKYKSKKAPVEDKIAAAG